MKWALSNLCDELEKSLPSRGAWIEIGNRLDGTQAGLSLPSRGAWIEILTVNGGKKAGEVAPLTGSVD